MFLMQLENGVEMNKCFTLDDLKFVKKTDTATNKSGIKRQKGRYSESGDSSPHSSEYQCHVS